MNASRLKIMVTGACLAVAALPLSAQQEPETGKSDQQKITLHISREVNGKTTVFDTTFTDPGNFDVDTFLQERGLDSDAPGDLSKNIEKEFKIVIPGLDEEIFRFDSLWPDTLDLSGNIHLFRHGPGAYRFEWKDYPGLKFDWNFPEPAWPGEDHGSKTPGKREECPRDPFFDRYFPYGFDNGFSFPGDHDVKVKTKRHGKKIVIRTYGDKEEGSCCPYRHERSMYEHHSGAGAERKGDHHQGDHEKKVRMEREAGPGNDDTKVEKRVIIIRKDDSNR